MKKISAILLSVLMLCTPIQNRIYAEEEITDDSGNEVTTDTVEEQEPEEPESEEPEKEEETETVPEEAAEEQVEEAPGEVPSELIEEPEEEIREEISEEEPVADPEPVTEAAQEEIEKEEKKNSVLPSEAEEIFTDRSAYVHIEKNKHLWLTFLPEETGYYSIGYHDALSCTVYDAEENKYTSLWDGENEGDMPTSIYWLTAGERYYIDFFIIDPYTYSISTYIECDLTSGLVAEIVGEKERHAELGGSETLEVRANSLDGKTISYSWFKNYLDENGMWQYEEIENERTNRLTVTNIQGSAEYGCMIEDSDEDYKTLYFIINVNHFSADARTSQFVLKTGSSAEMEVIVEADDLSSIRYQWYESIADDEGYYDAQIIPGATSATYSATAQEGETMYSCEVSDQYGNHQIIYFYITGIGEITEIPADQKKTISLNGNSVWLTFTAPDSRDYYLESFTNDAFEARVYDTNDFGTYTSGYAENGDNFQIDFSAAEGNTYYIQIIPYDEEYTGNLTVKMTSSIRVTFDAISGYLYDDTGEPVRIYNEYVYPGSGIIYYSPENEEHMFLKWCFDEALTQEVDWDFIPEADTTLYAKYDPSIIIYVTFHAGEGLTFDADNNEESYRYGFSSKYDVCLNEIYWPERTGYSVVDWYDNPELEGDPVSQNVPLTHNIDIYAKWTESFALTLHANDGYFLEYDEKVREKVIYCDPGEQVYEHLYSRNMPYHDTKTFEGWYTDPSFSASSKADGPFAADSDVDLYAKYTAGWKITFNANGSELTDECSRGFEIVPKNSNFQMYDDYAESEYNGKYFAGWSLTKTGTECLDANYIVTKNITVYAVYMPKITVTFKGTNVIFYTDEGDIENKYSFKAIKAKALHYSDGFPMMVGPKNDGDYFIEGYYTDSAYQKRIDNIYTYKPAGNVTIYVNCTKRPAYKGFDTYAYYNGQESKKLSTSTTNYLNVQADTYMTVSFNAKPAGALIKDEGSVALVEGEGVQYLGRGVNNGSDMSYIFFVKNTEPSEIRLKMDGKIVRIIVNNPGEFQFKDVKDPNKYYYDAVYWALQKGITTGTTATTFDPDKTCTRGHIVTFLWRLAGSPEPDEMGGFDDVPEGAWYEKAVYWAKKKGITTGTTPTTFQPTANCTRGHIVTFLWRYMGSPDCSDEEIDFKDVKPGAWYEPAVRWAKKNNVTTGKTPTQFDPAGKCTRGQGVLFLQRTAALEN